MEIKNTYSLITAFLPAAVLLCSCRQGVEAESPESRTGFGEIVDLTHEFSDETVYWVTSKDFELDTVFRGKTDKGYYYSAYNFATAEHGGTHLDAPVHFAENGQSVEQIPLRHLMGTAIKVDISEKAKTDPDYQVSVEDLMNWEREQGTEIPPASIVLLQTGYGDFYPDKKRYLGTDKKGEDALAELRFPGLSAAAAQWLVDNRYIHAVGIDTPSIDYGKSELFESHVILLSENIPAFENLAGLGKLPPLGFSVIALPMKIKGGSGAPLRIVAVLP